MANVTQMKRKQTFIELDKERELIYDLNSFAELEERYGTVDDALGQMEKGSIKAIRCVLWVGLIAEDETLTEKQVGRMITIQDLERLSETMNEAMTNDLPDRTVEDLPNA